MAHVTRRLWSWWRRRLGMWCKGTRINHRRFFVGSQRSSRPDQARYLPPTAYLCEGFRLSVSGAWADTGVRRQWELCTTWKHINTESFASTPGKGHSTEYCLTTLMGRFTRPSWAPAVPLASLIPQCHGGYGASVFIPCMAESRQIG